MRRGGRRSRGSQAGAAAGEYVLLLALVSIVTVLAAGALGSRVSTVTDTVGDQVAEASGSGHTSGPSAATNGGAGAASQSDTEKTDPAYGVLGDLSDASPGDAPVDPWPGGGDAAPAAGLTPTSLGVGWWRISRAMVDRIDAYRANYGRWPRGWAPHSFGDLDLDPDEWSHPVDGVLFEPGGSQLGLSPGPGYTFNVRTDGGSSIAIPHTLAHAIVYDVVTATWHYRRASGPSLRIDTLTVVRR